MAGEDAGRNFPADAQGTTIGRRTDNVVVLHDRGVSSHHAAVDHIADGAYILTDLGSTNGTLVNGSSLEAPRRLETGDMIELGKTVLRFEGAP